VLKNNNGLIMTSTEISSILNRLTALEVKFEHLSRAFADLRQEMDGLSEKVDKLIAFMEAANEVAKTKYVFTDRILKVATVIAGASLTVGAWLMSRFWELDHLVRNMRH
jgi:predicted transcriptional regulator